MRILLRVACGGFGLVAALLVAVSGLGESVDLNVGNLLMRYLGSRYEPDSKIVLVTCEGTSLGKFISMEDELKKVVDACSEAEAVGIEDLLLYRESTISGDEFQKALQKHGRVALAVSVQSDASVQPFSDVEPELDLKLIPYRSGARIQQGEATLTRNLVTPPLEWLKAASKLGHNFHPLSADRTVRSAVYGIPTPKGWLPSLGLATLMASPRRTEEVKSMILENAVQLSRPKELLYYRMPMTHVSSRDLLGLGDAWVKHKKNRQMVKDKLVLIGLDRDEKVIPMPHGMTALEIEGVALSNWLQGSWIRTLPWEFAILLSLLFALFPVWNWERPAHEIFFYGCMVLAFYHLIMVLAFVAVPFRLPWSTCMVAFAASGIFRVVEGGIREYRLRHDLEERQRTRQLLSNMLLHDLNTPVNNMIMLLESAFSEAPAEGKLRRRMEGAMTEGKRLTQLLRTLYDIEQMETHQVHPVQSKWVWISLVDEVIAKKRDARRARKVEISHQSRGTPREVTGDRRLLERVLSNLLDHAIDYSPEGKMIECETDFGLAQENRLIWKVKNHGEVIPGERIKNIFDPFIEPKISSTSRDGGGFGLGMAYCKLAIQAHDGVIQCHSPSPGWEDGVCIEIILTLTSEISLPDRTPPVSLSNNSASGV